MNIEQAKRNPEFIAALRQKAADVKLHAESISKLDAYTASRQWDYALKLELEAKLLEAA